MVGIVMKVVYGMLRLKKVRKIVLEDGADEGNGNNDGDDENVKGNDEGEN
jgi:hypothetical protein